MKVLLVRPRRRPQAITLGEFMFSEPLGLECVGGVLREAGHEVAVLDLMADAQSFAAALCREEPAVVGFTSLCVDVHAVLQLARETRALRPQAVTLVGGTQAVLAPESFFAPQVDHVFQHTTRANLLALFAALADGGPREPLPGVHSRELGFAAAGPRGVNEILPPDRALTARYRERYSYYGYRPCALLQTSRGCSAHCRFCVRWLIEGPRERDEPLGPVLDQLAAIREPSVMVVDNDFLHSGPRLAAFCDGLEARGIRKDFVCYGSVRGIVANAPAVERFSRLGLRAVLVGFESFNDGDLAAWGKPSSVAASRSARALLQAWGVDCWASFVLHPDWTAADFAALRRYVRELRPETTTLVPLNPFPGGLLAAEYAERCLLRPDDYDAWSFSQVAVRPGRMSLRRYYAEVLGSNLYAAFVVQRPSWLWRRFGFRTFFRIAWGAARLGRAYAGLLARG